MRYQFFTPLVASIAGVTLLASVRVRADDAPVTLKYVAKVGDSQHQQVIIKASIAGMDVVVKQAHKTVIKEVKDNGEVSMLETDEGSTVTLGGNDQHQDAVPDITIKRDKTGKMIDWKPAMDLPAGALSPEVLRTMAQMYVPVFPTTAVKSMDKWKQEFDNPILPKTKVKVEYTYLGIEKLDGKDLWKIKENATVATSEDGGSTTFVGTFWMNPMNGQTQKLEGEVKDVPTQFGNMSFSMVMTLIKDAKPGTTTPSVPITAPK